MSSATAGAGAAGLVVAELLVCVLADTLLDPEEDEEDEADEDDPQPVSASAPTASAAGNHRGREHGATRIWQDGRMPTTRAYSRPYARQRSGSRGIQFWRRPGPPGRPASDRRCLRVKIL